MSRNASTRKPARRSRTTDRQTIWRKARSALPDATVVVAFQGRQAGTISHWPEILKSLKAQSYVRVAHPRPNGQRDSMLASAGAGRRSSTASTISSPSPRLLAGAASIFVAQDRVESGRGAAVALPGGGRNRPALRPRRGPHLPRNGRRPFRGERPLLARPAFAENRTHVSRRHARACSPSIRRWAPARNAAGFGRIIDVDYRLAIPDHSLSLDAGAIKPWEGEIYGESKRDLYVFAKSSRSRPTCLLPP